MAAASTQQTDRYLASFARLEKATPANGQGWLRPVRRAAIARFAELGFPTTRDEDWRFTNVEPIAQTSFKPASDGPAELSRREIERFAFPGSGDIQLVFVNGRYAASLSSPVSARDGMSVRSLAEAITDHRDLLEQHLARYVDPHGDAFSALNTAFMEDGAFVHVPRGRVVEEAIRVLYVSTSTGEPIMTHPRNLIILDDNSQAIIVEDYVSLHDEVYFSNVVTEVVVGDSGVLSHYMIEQESKRAFNISTLRMEQGRSSNVTSHTMLLGGALVRNNVHPVLAGEGAECLINGLFMGTGQQHMDNFMRVEHASPHCDSRQFYQGILDGRAHGVFSGRIIVHKDAQKTDAKQTNNNLLLSQEAQIDSKPQLEIYADDVKCTHGATIGQIDENAIFYLRSRGIAEDAARALLLFGFANETLERMKVDSIRKHLEGLVAQWLPQGKLVEEVR
ncbi:MAG: Fe-S cluster assembly protein SufD [Candidatus Methylomirabilales bacterium]